MATGSPKRMVRRGFTMIEVLIAAMVLSMVAASSAALVSALSNASLSTREISTQQREAHFALTVFGRTLRCARGVGQVATTSINVWLGDYNENDKINLYEAGVLVYESAERKLFIEYLEAADRSIPATLVTPVQFKSVAALRALITGSDKKTVVWANDVDQVNLNCKPSAADANCADTDMRLLRLSLYLGSGSSRRLYHQVVGMRGSADYLFWTQTQSAPLPNSARKIRKYYSCFGGFTEHPSVTTLTAVPSM